MSFPENRYSALVSVTVLCPLILQLWDVASYGTKPPGVARGADGRWPRAAFATAEAYDVYQERMSRAFSFSENLAESLRKDYTTGAEVCWSRKGEED